MDTITTNAGRFMAEIKSTSADTKAPNGSFTAILSVPTKDRDGEVVDAGCFNPLPEHITIDIDHAMTVEKTVASGRPYYEGDVLKFDGTYASHPLAQVVRSLVDEKHIRTMSVAYMGAQYEIDEKDGLPHLRSAELLNAGIVGIPSNREALITASKALNGQPPSAATVKSIVGSYEDRTDRLRQAIRLAYPLAEWAWCRATFDDRVVFDVEVAHATHTFQASYTVDESGAIVLGEAVEVDLAEIVVTPTKAADRTEISTATTPEQGAAAKAAVAAPAPVDVAALTARARASAAVSATALLQ